MLLSADADGPHVFVHVEVDPAAEPIVGYDPELPADAQELAGVAWRPFTDLAEDCQVLLLTGALGPGWWRRLPTAAMEALGPPSDDQSEMA